MTEQIQEIEQVKSAAIDYRKKCLDVVIVDQASFNEANELLKEAKRHIKMVDEKLGPAKAKAYGAYKEIQELIKELQDPFQRVEKDLKSKVGEYILEQDRIRRVQEEKIRKEAEERRLKDAQVLEEAGLNIDADELLDKKIRVNSSDITPKLQKSGTGASIRWYAEVTDLKALVGAVSHGDIPLAAVLPNMAFLNSQAAQDKDAMNIPGVKAVSKTSVSVRAQYSAVRFSIKSFGRTRDKRG